ncbi:MAG: hypothetical protein ACI96M_000451 [Candidatus Azotimanducaceae bacterium]|jgi:hypothetical protein
MAGWDARYNFASSTMADLIVEIDPPDGFAITANNDTMGELLKKRSVSDLPTRSGGDIFPYPTSVFLLASEDVESSQSGQAHTA